MQYSYWYEAEQGCRTKVVLVPSANVFLPRARRPPPPAARGPWKIKKLPPFNQLLMVRYVEADVGERIWMEVTIYRTVNDPFPNNLDACDVHSTYNINQGQNWGSRRVSVAFLSSWSSVPYGTVLSVVASYDRVVLDRSLVE